MIYHVKFFWKSVLFAVILFEGRLMESRPERVCGFQMDLKVQHFSFPYPLSLISFHTISHFLMSIWIEWFGWSAGKYFCGFVAIGIIEYCCCRCFCNRICYFVYTKLYYGLWCNSFFFVHFFFLVNYNCSNNIILWVFKWKLHFFAFISNFSMPLGLQ